MAEQAYPLDFEEARILIEVRDRTIETWKSRAHDLALSNERLRLAVSVLKGDLAEEIAKHA